MRFSSTIIIISSYYLNIFVIAENDCYKKGVTWSEEGQIEVLYAVSPEECLASVIDDPEAKGFSYYYNAHDVDVSICVIFGTLEGETECSHECTSFKMPSENNNCVCSKQEGDCDVTDNNYIGFKDATSEFGCFIECAIT